MTSNPRLTERQVSHYNEEGYVVYRQPVYSEAKFNALKECFEELLEAQVRDGKRPEAMDKPHFLHPRLFDWVLDDAVLDLVEPILGLDCQGFYPAGGRDQAGNTLLDPARAYPGLAEGSRVRRVH